LPLLAVFWAPCAFMPARNLRISWLIIDCS